MPDFYGQANSLAACAAQIVKCERTSSGRGSSASLRVYCGCGDSSNSRPSSRRRPSSLRRSVLRRALVRLFRPAIRAAKQQPLRPLAAAHTVVKAGPNAVAVRPPTQQFRLRALACRLPTRFPRRFLQTRGQWSTATATGSSRRIRRPWTSIRSAAFRCGFSI